MSREIITAERVLQVAPGGTLHFAPDALVTPLARDVAAERRVTLRSGPPAPTPTRLGADEALIREIVTRVLSGSPQSGRHRPTVKLARGDDAELERFPFPGPGPDQTVRALDVVTADDGAPMAAGFMTLTEGSFPWTLTYDEIQVVLEGELHLGGDGGGQVGRPGDVFFVPKGSSITFGTPTWARFVYVTFPADWAEQT